MINVNCTSWRPHDGACLHQAAPRKLIGLPQCILAYPQTKDPRVMPGCVLCTQHPRQLQRPEPPPPAAVDGHEDRFG